MPRIFDNIESRLGDGLREALASAARGDFCVGYFNLRGWRLLDSSVDHWSGSDENCCRLLVGMHRTPEESIRLLHSATPTDELVDQATARTLHKQIAEDFRRQLASGVPSNEDELGLRRLAGQLRSRRVRTKLYLRHPLHAKLYLCFRSDPTSPSIGFLGSSNLTLPGLLRQGELNIDVLDHDACVKLAKWFDDRWSDRFCIDISNELADIIDQSWAAEQQLSPYLLYLKIAYHLCREAREGVALFDLPAAFRGLLFEYQAKAVQLAAQHLNRRGGVILGDVVGLGKTMMASALARMLEDDLGFETLILCPPKLQRMWDDYRQRFGLRATIVPISQVQQQLPELRRHRLVIIDESHNLRNRQGNRYLAIREYLAQNESKVIMLSATPYNKSYGDLASQLRLFVEPDQPLPCQPEKYVEEIGETEFIRRHQCRPNTIDGFEKSVHADDWRQLMQLYLVRRTRGFIRQHYAQRDGENGRQYLTLADGTRNYFPDRVPKVVKFECRENDPTDQYATLYSPAVVQTLSALHLPRYGLKNYLVDPIPQGITAEEQRAIDGLSRAGQRMMGFCRVGLFKRLESSGGSFILSLERHILRNALAQHALDNGLPLPIGKSDFGEFDPSQTDGDAEPSLFESENGEAEDPVATVSEPRHPTRDFIRAKAAELYALYRDRYSSRFRWLPSGLFTSDLSEHLRQDCDRLLAICDEVGPWRHAEDAKLNALTTLLQSTHADEKVLVFTQYADTAEFLVRELERRGVTKIAAATGNSSEDPTSLAYRFSPRSNLRRPGQDREELRVLVATDVLSEGQNLQDAHVVVNYDLPWAIIRLIQRAGRVDRIGQQSPTILCYSFMPAEGVDTIIRLRTRIRARLRQNAEVVGTDEAFFEDEAPETIIRDLYNERSGVLNDADGGETDLASYAYGIWKDAKERDPSLERVVPALPDVVYTAKAAPADTLGPGAIVYVRTGDDVDALARVNPEGKVISMSQRTILDAAACPPDTAPAPRGSWHHEAVAAGASHLLTEQKRIGGQLGGRSGARFRVYDRLNRFVQERQGTLFVTDELKRAIEDVYRSPLRPVATETLNRQLKSGISDEDLASLVVAMRAEGRLTVPDDQRRDLQPRLICSLGLVQE